VLVPILFGMIAIDGVEDLQRYYQTSGAQGGSGLLVFLALFGGFGVLSYRFEVRMAEHILRNAFERKGGVLS
jgi:hypothetical protein